MNRTNPMHPHPLQALLAVALLAGCSTPAQDARHVDEEAPRRIARIASPHMQEPSGLVKSRRLPGVFWTHNDSGDVPRIFALNANGRLFGEFPVTGARNVDWEDIAIDDKGNLYVADFGNNFSSRRHLVVYRVPEPTSVDGSGTARVDQCYRFRYADQTGYPGLGRWNYDAEALFWMEDALWILTKHHMGNGTRLYRLAPQGSRTEMVLAPVMGFELGDGDQPPRAVAPNANVAGGLSLAGTVTAADYDPKRRLLAVLTYTSVLLFARTADAKAPFRPLRRISLRGRGLGQVESLAWDTHGLVLGNEDAWLFSCPIPVGTSR